MFDSIKIGRFRLVEGRVGDTFFLEDDLQGESLGPLRMRDIEYLLLSFANAYRAGYLKGEKEARLAQETKE